MKVLNFDCRQVSLKSRSSCSEMCPYNKHPYSKYTEIQDIVDGIFGSFDECKRTIDYIIIKIHKKEVLEEIETL